MNQARSEGFRSSASHQSRFWLTGHPSKTVTPQFWRNPKSNLEHGEFYFHPNHFKSVLKICHECVWVGEKIHNPLLSGETLGKHREQFFFATNSRIRYPLVWSERCDNTHDLAHVPYCSHNISTDNYLVTLKLFSRGNASPLPPATLVN